MPSAWFHLVVAILCEIVATSALKESDGLRRLLPSAIALAGYGVAFWALAKALRAIPLGIAYAVWSGVGIAGLALIGALLYRQALTPLQLAGIATIILGVLMLAVAR